MSVTVQLTEKVKEVTEEMQRAGLWKRCPPAWVNDFEQRNIVSGEDFAVWLQFVYLPNLLQKTSGSTIRNGSSLIVPQALRFFRNDLNRGKLLKLLIELDAL